MVFDYFQTWPELSNRIVGTYDLRLILLSYLVAVFASYIALDITGRLRDPGNTKASSMLWLLGGAISMGAGIWAMHFIGMLSFSVPMIGMHYDLFWTAFSLLVAVVASGFALSMLGNKNLNFVHLGFGGVILGLAIAAMHYTGMHAMEIVMGIHYLPSLFFLSIFIAIAASEAALWLAIKSNHVILVHRQRLKLISALIMGVGICGMHYTGMAAAVFGPLCAPQQNIADIDPTMLSMSIAGVTFIILGIAFFASTYKEAMNQQEIQKARQLGMAEVAASVLHNIGNVLNSILVSTNLLSEKMVNIKMDGIDDLRHLINEHKNDLGLFITQDPRGAKIPTFLNKLADYWLDEKKIISNEVATLKTNLEHVNEIIKMHQGLTKKKSSEQIVAVEDILNESLLIVGLDINDGKISFQKQYEKLKPIKIDKIKLQQILINLLSNAKEALKISTKQDKLLIIKSLISKNNRIIIQFIDNGIGISPANLKKIFIYGFTTKETGHGYGLHSCALALNEMGGSIQIESDGLEKGTTVTIELPYNTPRESKKSDPA